MSLQPPPDSCNLAWVTDTASSDPAWDAFLERSPHGHHEQTSRWGQVKANYGWRPVRLKASCNGELVAGVQVLLRSVRRFVRVGYICKGPVFDLANSALRQEVVRYLHAWASQQHLFYLVVELPYQGHALADDFDTFDFRPHPAKLPPSGLMGATLTMDLSYGPDTLVAAMNRTKRKRVRRSLKSDLVFREGRLEDAAVFRRLLMATCLRHKCTPTPSQPDFFENLWKAFDGTGWMRIFVVESAGKPVHSMITFQFGEWFRTWKMGWSGEADEKNPDEFHFWNLILWAKEHGFRWFDFVWLDRDSAIRYKNGERPSAVWQPEGMSFAKFGWGGEILVLPQPRSRFFHPAFHLLSRWGGYRFLDSPRFSRWASRLHG